MQIVVDMDGGAYVLRDLLTTLGHRPGDALDVRVDGDRLVITHQAPVVERRAVEPMVEATR